MNDAPNVLEIRELLVPDSKGLPSLHSADQSQQMPLAAVLALLRLSAGLSGHATNVTMFTETQRIPALNAAIVNAISASKRLWISPSHPPMKEA